MAQEFSMDYILPNLKGKTVSLYSDITFTRKYLIDDFLLKIMESGGVACVVTLNKGASQVIEELSSVSNDATMIVNEAILNERLQIIDLYSYRSGIPEDRAPGTYFLDTVSDLTELSIYLNRISKQFDDMRIVINPFSLLAIYSPEKSLIDFLQTLSARVSARNQSCLLVLDHGVIDESQLAKIESVIDGAIELRRDENSANLGEKFRIKFFRGLRDSKFFNWSQIS